MRGGILPAALIFAALGFALSFAPRRIQGLGLVAAAIAALLSLQLQVDPAHAEAVYLAVWSSIVVSGASVHLPDGIRERGGVLLALVCGAAAGAVIGLAGGWPDLALAALAILVILPGTWLVGSGRGIAVKVMTSWLIAIALLAAALPLTPTPGYAPDHME